MSELEPGVPQVFMLKRFHLRLGALAIVLFTLAPVLSVVGTALDEPPPRRLLLLQAIFVVGYSFPLSLGVWMVLEYLWKSITVTGDELCVRGMTKRSRIQLGQLTRARWSPAPLSLELFLAAGKHTVKFGEFRHGGRLLRYFREHIRPEIQENWGPELEACLAIADWEMSQAVYDRVCRRLWWIVSPVLLVMSGTMVIGFHQANWVLVRSTGSALADWAVMIFLVVAPWGALRIFKWAMQPEQ